MPAKTRRVRVPGVARIPEGEARKIVVPAEDDHAAIELVLVRLDGRLHALDSLCPHEGGRLNEGPLWEGRYVACPLHLYRFDPRSGAAVDVECAPAKVYAVREVGGVAEVEVESD